VDPAGPDRGSLPSGPHPTVGPGSVRMPRWPGPLLIVGGALLALVSLSTLLLVAEGELVLDDPSTFAWLALAGALLFVTGLVYSAVRQIRVRRYLPPERYRGPGVLLLLVLVLVVSAVITAPFSADASALLLGDGEPTLLGTFVVLVATQASLLLVSWLFVFRPRALVGWPSWAGRNPGGALRIGLGWGLLAWVGSVVVSAAMALLFDALGMEVAPQDIQQALQALDPWLAVLAIVILAPIAEEVFFRGVVFNAWLREGGRAWAYLGSSALFAVIHLSLIAVVPIFLLGLALAWVYRRSGNLLAPIAMHAVVNGMTVGLILAARYELIPMPV
jgi:membrane protease YdiL (CAAX protease family)